MKYIIAPLFLLLAFLTVNAQNNDAAQDVPAKIKTYLTKYFPSNTVVRYKTEAERSGTEHKIYLNNYTKLEFNNSHEIVEIDSESKLPESVFPAKIVSYVKANYPNFYIVSWEKKSKKQEVELNNDLELEFDLNGNFLRIDD